MAKIWPRKIGCCLDPQRLKNKEAFSVALLPPWNCRFTERISFEKAQESTRKRFRSLSQIVILLIKYLPLEEFSIPGETIKI